MPYGWTPSKAAKNLEKHGVGFDVIEGFDWSTALVRADTRHDYGEVRLVALGLVVDRLHQVTFTIRRNMTWIISLRKASDKEIANYESEN